MRHRYFFLQSRRNNTGSPFWIVPVNDFGSFFTSSNLPFSFAFDQPCCITSRRFVGEIISGDGHFLAGPTFFINIFHNPPVSALLLAHNTAGQISSTFGSTVLVSRLKVYHYKRLRDCWRSCVRSVHGVHLIFPTPLWTFSWTPLLWHTWW